MHPMAGLSGKESNISSSSKDNHHPSPVKKNSGSSVYNNQHSSSYSQSSLLKPAGDKDKVERPLGKDRFPGNIKDHDSDEEQVKQQVFFPSFKAPIEDEVDDGVSDEPFEEEKKQGEEAIGGLQQLMSFFNLGQSVNESVHNHDDK